MLHGVHPKYWLDLRGYDPPAVAKTLKQPKLILQAERDYRVTMDDFERWRQALSDQERVELRS